MAQAQTQPEHVAVPKKPTDLPIIQQRRHDRMREYFANQPKESIRIRKELGEQWVQVNGYAFRIQAGEKVKVPRDVAELLREADII